MQKSDIYTLTRLSKYFWASVFLFGFCGVAPVDGFAQDSNDSVDYQRSIGEYRKDLKSFMKLSRDRDPQQERNAIFNLCQLHHEIVCDSRFETSQQIQGIRAVVANRLEKFAKDERNARLREERASRKPKLDSESELQVQDPESEIESESKIEASEEKSSADHNYDDSESGSESSLSGATESSMYSAASDSYSSIGAASGGPNQLFDYAGRMGPPWDHGEDLVDLIVNTIDPTFWRQNGGSGSIHYYQPSLALVIHAPLQGQEAAADLMNRLRQNGDAQLNIGGGFGALGK